MIAGGNDARHKAILERNRLSTGSFIGHCVTGYGFGHGCKRFLLMNQHTVIQTDNAGCFCDKHWQAMCGCGLFNARVWLGCLRSGIESIEQCDLDKAESQLVKAFVAGKLFFREHEVTADAISVLADTTSVLYVCLKRTGDLRLAIEVVTSTAHTLSRVMHSVGLRQEAMQACNHLLMLNDVPAEVPTTAQLAMCRYIENPSVIAH
jgi:hypothetical protein